MRRRCQPWDLAPRNLAHTHTSLCSPPPASEASGGEGSGVGGAACSEQAASRLLRLRSKRSPPTPRSAASLPHSTLPANGREGRTRHLSAPLTWLKRMRACRSALEGSTARSTFVLRRCLRPIRGRRERNVHRHH